MRNKPYTQMNVAELEQATREFDQEFVAAKGRALNARQRAQHHRAAKRGRGRPQIGKGFQRVTFSIEQELLKQTDRFAKSDGKKRSEVIAEGLAILLGRKAG